MIRTFGSIKFAANGSIASRSLGKPTAMYPGAVATDAQLTIGVDRLQTRLAAPLSVIAVSMTVVDGTGIVPNTLLSIDDEIVRTNAGAGNVWSITRGWDGTIPASHLASALVSGFVDAWHHNALVSEIQAIEQTLGPNLANIPQTAVFTPKPWSQTPTAGALVVGANVITLSPVPEGVNGTDQNHLLYVSGTGTSETVPIIGGTAVSGAPTGTVIVTCAFPHPAGWTIGTATAGIQEAMSLGHATYPNGFLASVPPGVHDIYGPIQIPWSGIVLGGYGVQVSSIRILTLNTDAIQILPAVSGFYNAVRDLSIAGMELSASGWAINTRSQTFMVIEKVAFQYFYNGIRLNDAVQSVIRDVFALAMHGGDGLFLTGSLTNIVVIDNFESSTLAGGSYHAGIVIEESGNAILSHCTTLAADVGLHMVAPAGKFVASTDIAASYFDSSKFAAVRLGAVDFVVGRCSFVQCWMSNGGLFGATAFGVQFLAGAGTVEGIKFIGCEISNNGNNGIEIPVGCTVKDLLIQGCTISNNASASGISISDPGAAGIRIEGCAIGNDLGAWEGGNQQLGINSLALANQLYTNNFFSGNKSQALQISAAGLTAFVIGSNNGVDDIVPTIASAATVELPVNPTIHLTGTTTITQFLRAWTGRNVTVIKTDAGSLTIGGGGNIPLARTLTQNQSMTFVYDGTNWY